MLPIINVTTRIGCWVLALATLPHWQHFFPGSRPQRLTQVASRHARVTLASMWLRRAMPYATIDPRVGRMDLRQKRLWRSRHGRRRSHIGFDAAFASGHRPVALMGERGPGNREINVDMWKQPIPMLPIINVSTRIGCWVLALATLPHWQHFFPCFGAVAA